MKGKRGSRSTPEGGPGIGLTSLQGEKGETDIGPFRVGGRKMIPEKRAACHRRKDEERLYSPNTPSEENFCESGKEKSSRSLSHKKEGENLRPSHQL